MKLGILGIDARIAQVVAAAAGRGDTLALACDLPPSGPLAASVPADVPRDTWEGLLDPRGCDAVLVGGDGWSDGRADAVRALVQAGRTMLLSHPLVLSMLWCYELDMIRGDSGARLIPWLPDRLHPFIRRLRERIEAGLAGAHPHGPVETVSLERRLADRTRESVLRALAADVDLVRALVGDPSRLSTLGGGDADTAWSTLAVGFSGPAQVPVRWQVVGGAPPGGLRIRLAHARGSATVEIPDDPPPGDGSPDASATASGPARATASPWIWSDEPAETASHAAASGDRAATACFDRGGTMLDLLHGDVPATTAITPAAWSDAARAVELAETVPRSLAKGRAIDLHQEEFSELGTFRGTMASLGCGLVLAALFLLVLATLVGGIARQAGWEWGERVAGVWPQLVLAALALFLALQLLPSLVGVRPPPSSKGIPPHPRRRE